MEDKILGALYGMAYGDAFAMPPELWPRQRVKDHFGIVTEFLDGPQENEVSKWFTKGQFTDDTSQAIWILDTLIANDMKVDRKKILECLLEWAIKHDAFNKKFFGPSSEAVLRAAKEGKDTTELTKLSQTNGAAMRIAPIGCMIDTNHIEDLAKLVADISKCTHGSDVAIAGAALIAGGVSAAIDGFDFEDIAKLAIKCANTSLQYGEPTFSPSIEKRTLLGMELAQKYKDDDEAFSQNLYDIVGAGVHTAEAAPCAFSIAYYAQTPDRCAYICANLGGDSDTIGAMATAICGAKYGASSFKKGVIPLLKEANNVDFSKYVKPLIKYRENHRG